MNYQKMYESCTLCARGCGVDRTSGALGYCRSSNIPHIFRAALHMWEEPIISGGRGSGTIFFSGCSLGCVFCQNRAISRSQVGREYSDTAIAEAMLELEGQGAHNINFVTPTHFSPTVISAVAKAREMGLTVPIVYNTGSFDSLEALRALQGSVDIYLPDLKCHRASTAKALFNAEAYPTAARAAIAEMVRQQPRAVIENGIMRSGVIVRILLLPMHVAEAKLSLKYLYGVYGDDIYISLMNQYTPMKGMPHPLDRTVTVSEYSELVRYAERLGVVNAFTQEWGTQKESFIPDFNL